MIDGIICVCEDSLMIDGIICVCCALCNICESVVPLNNFLTHHYDIKMIVNYK